MASENRYGPMALLMKAVGRIIYQTEMDCLLKKMGIN
jgi:hypothetical protein